MRSLRPETRWRYVPKGWDPSCLWPNGRPPTSPSEADEPQAAWIFPCPNPGCESELVILSEQAGFWVECPDCGLRFCCPRPASPEVVAKAKAMRPAPPQETKAAGALEALAKASRTPGSHPAPARRAAIVFKEGPGNRRTQGRIDLEALAHGTPVVPMKPVARRGIRTDLVLTWVIASLVTGGVVAASVISGVPDMALASLFFIGLAVVRTVLVCRKKPA